jgi:PAS domain S-box-containing protein
VLDIINTGKSIKELKTGDHLCLIYESEEEWQRVVTEFIKDGLERREKCIYIYNFREPDKLRDCFTEIMAFDNLEDSGSFVFHSFRDLCRNIEMDQYAMIYFLSKLSDRSISEGYTGLRIVMEMGSDDSFKSQDMLEFEARLNRYLFSKYCCLALCLYDQREHDPQVIKDIIVTHPLIVRGDRLYSNNHYMKPAYILGRDKKKQGINKLLDVIERENKNNDSLQFLNNVFNESLLAFCALSGDGVIMVCNPTFCEMTGYSSEQIYQKVRFLELIPQEYWDLHWQALKNLNISGVAQRYEAEIIRHDASSICIEILLHKSKSGGSKDSYYFMFLNDITEFKLNEKRLIFLSQRDSLTGLYNRGYFEEILNNLETNKGHLCPLPQ